MDLHSALGVGGKDTVDDAAVVVQMRVETRAEAMHEAHRPQTRPATRPGARLAQGLLDHPQEDAQDRTDPLRVAHEEVAQALGHHQHPLPHRHPRQHMVHQVRRGLGHPPGITRGTDGAGAAGERHQEVVATCRAPGSPEAMRQHATGEVLAEIPLHERGHPGSLELALLLERQPRFQVLAHDRVQHRALGPARAVPAR